MDLRSIFQSPAVRRARSRAHELGAETLEEQIRLALIPAPPFGEAERGAYVRTRFEALGLEGVETDAVGNVIGKVPAADVAGPGAEPLVVTAHLDTVFPAGTELKLRRERERVLLPGIADNARGLAALLTVVRIVRESGPILRRPVTFVATVGEEGAGDLRGVKHLFRDGSPLRSATGFVSIDGSGVQRIVHRGVGSARYRVTFEGSGGHSWADWGIANPLSAMGIAVAGLAGLEVPERPRTTLTVARCGGGTSINAIPEAAWLELDMRSEDESVLSRLEATARRAVKDAVRRENRGRRARTRPVRERWDGIGRRPAGSIRPDAALVRWAVAATEELGVGPELAASSTDSNVPLALGIPAVTVGAGGSSGGIHTVEEWYGDEGGATGVERAVLLVVAACNA
jgi:tripeptide aminopeptidase